MQPIRGPESVSFFTIGNAAYFPGIVGLLNSLRLLGHGQQLFILDHGFTEAQRQALLPHCTLLRAPDSYVTNSALFKPFAHLVDPDGVVVTIDSDVLLTRSLEEIVAQAAEGCIVAYPDPEDDRVFAEWEEVFELPAAPRQQAYVCSHFVAFSTRHWPDLLGQWWEACQRIYTHPTIAEVGTQYPGATTQADQDALNALLMTRVPSEALLLLPPEERPHSPFLPRVEIVDAQTLACRFEGHATTMLHADGNPKPWRRQAWVRVRDDAYVRLLKRLLHGDDVAMRWPASESLPPWLRRGVVGDVPLRLLGRVNSIPRRKRRELVEKLVPQWLLGRALERLRPS